MSKKGEIIQTEKNFKQIEQQIKENEDKIGVLKEDLNNLQSNKIFNASCIFENNNYILTLNENDLKLMTQYFTIRFKAPNDYVEGSGFFIGNLCYTPKNANFEYGDVVTAEFEYLGMEGHCFFKSGGGGITETLPPQIENFNAIAGDGWIELSWTIKSKTYLNGYVFVVKEKEIPNNINDGIKYEVTKDKNNVVIDGLENDVLYCARSFPYNSKNQYQTEYMIIGAMPKNTMLLKDLPIGSKVKDLESKYNGEVISWIIADKNHSGYPSNSITLVSEKWLCEKTFDTKEPNNPDDKRKEYGNNRYSVSNIRQWLNSDEQNWFVKQHEYDEPPSSENVSKNPYDFEKGFMCNLSSGFKNSILDTNLTVAKPSVDGGGSENVTDKIFLLSRTEVGLGDGNEIAEGNKLALFTDDESRKLSNCYWWLRTPQSSISHGVLAVQLNGVGGGFTPGNSKIRPSLNLKPDTIALKNPDSNGCHILKL